jgi:hypothetical protein
MYRNNPEKGDEVIDRFVSQLEGRLAPPPPPKAEE